MTGRASTGDSGGAAGGPVRWCEHTTTDGTGCPRLAVVLVADFAGYTANVCRDHWHHLHRTTRGQVRAVQLLTRHRPEEGPR